VSEQYKKVIHARYSQQAIDHFVADEPFRAINYCTATDNRAENNRQQVQEQLPQARPDWHQIDMQKRTHENPS